MLSCVTTFVLIFHLDTFMMFNAKSVISYVLSKTVKHSVEVIICK